MRSTLLIAVIATAMAGCATASKTYGPDGREAYSIGCSGAALSWGMCLEKAGSLCGAKGYDVLSSNGETGSVAAASANRYTSNFFGGSTVSRSMLISCKP